MKKVISICITSMLFLSAYSYADHPNYYAQQEAKQQARTTINMTASKQSLFATQSLNQDSRVTNS